MKKYISLILGFIALAVVAALFIYVGRQPQKNVGDSESDAHQLAMQLSEDGSFYTVTGLGNYEKTDIVIPPVYKDIPVREIGLRAFWEKSEITSVTIPDTVEVIREAAFRGNSITEIVIPDSVKTVEGYAFADCENLRKAVLPKRVDSLGENIFLQCHSLEEIDLPENLEEIPAYMFFDCYRLKSVSLPEHLLKIGERAFQRCESIKTVDLPDGLKEIGLAAFSSAGIDDLKIPDSVEIICDWAFDRCPIKNIDLPDGLSKLGKDAFRGTEIETAFIPASVVEIGDAGSFAGCKNLKELTISDENPVYYSINNCIVIRETGELIFAYSPESVPTDGSIKIIGRFAYSRTDADTVVIPEGVKELRSYAIDDFDRIGEIILPTSLEKLNRASVRATSSGGSPKPVKKILFRGTHDQWAAMDRPDDWLDDADKVLIIDLTA